MVEIVTQALVIGGFVTVMMLIIEYINVFTSGAWQGQLARRPFGQYILAGLLGAVPGCLGAFAVVAMYSHGIVSFGAVAAAMIATSGDESFVVLALVPRQAAILFTTLFVTGIAAGALTDVLAKKLNVPRLAGCASLAIHPAPPCECFPQGRVLDQWRDCSAPRGILAGTLSLLIAGVLAGELLPTEWNWVRFTLLAVSAAALFIVGTVPDHFLEEHLWQHVIRGHALQVFLWTLAALAAIHLATQVFHLDESIRESGWMVLLVACLAGLIPESGPHLVFVTLFAQGIIPFSVLLASSIVQDGHGMLPLLAESRRAFLVVKAINLVAGLLVGAIVMSVGC